MTDREAQKQIDWTSQDMRNMAFTAMCIWEAMIDDPGGPWETFCENNGANALREVALDLTVHAERQWRSLTDKEQEFDEAGAFDWDWIPLWLQMAVDWSGDWPQYKAGVRV